MKKYRRVFLVLVGVLFFTGCGQKEESAPQEKITDMKSYVEMKCSQCHFSERVYKKRRAPEEWLKIVKRMRAINPQLLSQEDINRIAEYLIVNNSLSEDGETPQ